MHLLWYLWIFLSYCNIAIIASYMYIFQGWWLTAQEITCQGIMSLFFSLNLHAEPTSTPLLPPLLIFICTLYMDWTPPDFRKQFRSTISAGQPQLPKQYIKHDKCTTFLSVIKLDYQQCQQQNPPCSYLWHSQQQSKYCICIN